MDYYESSRPQVDDSGLSGGVAFNFGGQIATFKSTKSYVGFNYANINSSSSSQTIVTLDICVDGVPKKLDVYAAGEPY